MAESILQFPRAPLSCLLASACCLMALSAGAPVHAAAPGAVPASPANAPGAAASAGSRRANTRVAAPVGDGDASVNAAAAGGGSSGAAHTTVPSGRCDWPDWRGFVAAHVQADGRVIDYGPPQQTTSEGESYAMFFALVNNDRATFDKLLASTEANLGSGDLSARLPAWQWGQRKDGSWGVIDQNSASDADLWIAYALFEAGRLWHQSRYTNVARQMLEQVKRSEMFALPGFGPMLAPGQTGFQVATDVWRINPSYLPIPLLRLFARNDPQGPWKTLASNTVSMLRATSPRGFAPDWAGFQTGKGFIVDPQRGDVGSYDAIRVYLWAGLTPKSDPLSGPLLAALGGMRAAVQSQGMPPEKVSTLTGAGSGAAPAGFAAALLPYLKAQGASAPYATMQSRAGAASAMAGKPPVYYDRVLQLFGQGFADGRYRFDANGRLLPRWDASCRQ